MAEAPGSPDPPISNQLANLVPSFDPSKDNMTIYQQKVELVLAAWPKTKITELVTRLILNCHGTAFQKLQLHQAELLAENDEKAVKQLIKLLGGQWGRISLEQQYQDAEAALFQTLQKQDESNDSYLARSDVQWMKLRAQKLKIEDLQAFVVLRGSQLSPEDKKKVILESDNSLEGKLTMTRVSEAIRLLGASFFQDMTGGKKNLRTKVYDQSAALLTETVDDETTEAFATNHDENEDEYFDHLLQDGDEDATLVADFEQAASETLQEDSALAEAYNAYQEARRRLSEKFRNRGFWPTSKGNYGAGKGKGGKFQNKGKGKNNQFGGRPRRSLQDRIMNSACRICLRTGHWKAECPYRNSAPPQTPSTASGAAPTTTTVIEQTDKVMDPLPMEFLNLPEHQPIDHVEDPAEANRGKQSIVSHVGLHADVYHMGILLESRENKHGYVGPGHERLQRWITRNEKSTTMSSHVRNAESAKDRLHQFNLARAPNRIRPEPDRPKSDHSPIVQEPNQVSNIPRIPSISEEMICFATYGSMGVLDLGASKTVIGSDFVTDLIESLCPANRQHLTRGECKVTFRFGNQGTLQSQQAIIIPIGRLLLKIAVVPGGTPFLLSNSLMRAMSAKIDCETHHLCSPMLSKPIKLKLTTKGLFLIDLDEMATKARRHAESTTARIPLTETFVSASQEETASDAASSESPSNRATTTTSVKNLNPNNQTEVKSATESCTAEVIATTPATVISSEAPIVDSESSFRDVVAAASPSHAGEGPRESHRLGSPDQSRPGDGHHRLRVQTQGKVIHRSLDRRSGVGAVHGDPLSQESEALTSQVPPFCGALPGGAREEPDADSSPDQGDRRRTQKCQDEVPDGQGQAKVQDAGLSKPSHFQWPQRSPRVSYAPTWSRPRWGFRGRLDASRDVIPTDYDLRIANSGSSPSPGRPSDDDGELVGPRHELPGEPGIADSGAQRRSVSELIDFQADVHTAMHTDRRKLNQLIVQISTEFEEQVSKQKSLGTRWLLGEIFCSEQSPLTQQVNNLGAKGFRFGLTDGDLSTKEGRFKLFQRIITHRPKSLWYSPVCGPWSSWSNLNAARSLEQWDEHHKTRQALLYQVALGIVLYRHQVSHGDHFHWEQPSRSLMFKIPGMSEVQVHTQTCEFDMCRAGDLRDPINNLHLKKGMEVITTSPTLFKFLHGQKCNRQHEHQPIEGSITTSTGTIRRSQFTEVYPRKFARSVAKQLMYLREERPFHWDPKIHLRQVPTDPVYAARTGTIPYRDRFPKSELILPLSENDPRLKRRRLNGKQSLEMTQELGREIIELALQEVPRVGKRVIQNIHTRELIQKAFPDKIVVSVIGCRGTDRTLGPPKNISSKEAPFRRTIMEIRHTNEVKYEAYWEKWDQLSQRQLVRPAHPCKLNLTVFARDRTEPEAVSTQDAPMPNPNDPRSEDSLETPAQSSGSNHEPRGTTTPTVTESSPVESRLRYDSLAPWEKQMLRQMHVNLGHPSNERLSRALVSQGYRPEVIQAARELPCETCAKCAGPKHQRPAALKPILDFNHRIYIDAIDWTNKQNKILHFYHILDAGTNFHTAIISPSTTSTNIIQLLHQHWFLWAGIPTEIVVDSGTELNSNEFQDFLQKYGIRSITTNPEAHWQSGRIERHGSFLQSMLTKIDTEMGIEGYPELQEALNQCTNAKNTLSSRHGYSPEIIVFGRQSRLPGSILNDEAIPSHLQALQEVEQEVDNQSFRKMLQLRETARRAYHAADNCDTLRRSVLRRSCPSRGVYKQNQWVMIWRSVTNPKGKQWIGPQKVILQDADHTVWTTQCGRLYRSAPENVRLSTPNEGQPENAELPEDLTSIEKQIQTMREEGTSQSEIPQVSTEDIPSEQPSIDPPQDLPIDGVPNVPMNRETSADESIPQPDQEPENNSPPISAIPSMESAEHELVCLLSQEVGDAFTSTPSSDTAWRCEFDVQLNQPLSDHIPQEEESWLLLATSAKKQRTEVRLTDLNPDERKEFDKAKQSEIANWIQTGTLTKVLRDQIPEDQILKCRWILTWKPIDQCDGANTKAEQNAKTHKAKARLVILGYLDPQIENIPRDSPTLNKTSRMIILQAIASHMWKVCSFDIKAAFLQGQPQSTRVMGLDPVPELRRAMNMQPHEIGKLNKGAYGLIDAPYLWYCALVQELTSLGFEISPFDPCLFVLREPADSATPGQLAGILGVHVDDGIGGGNAYYQSKIDQLETKFPFGSKKISNFTFTGVEINQQTNGNITMNQSAYVRKVKSIQIDPNRKTQPDLKVTEDERLSLRGVIGSLQYAAINTRPDLSSRLSMLQSQINSATIETLQEANRVLHEAKRYHDMTITIRPIPVEHFRFMAFSDASFSSKSKPDSHAGLIIVGTHQDILKNFQCPISPLTWGCRKIQKVVTSTLSAETMSLASALDQLSWLRIFWSWIHDSKTPWKHPERALEQIPEAISSPTLKDNPDVAVTDCKSLFDLTTRTAPPNCAEFRTQLVARSIKESLKEGVALRWVSSGAQLADALTKAMEAHFLRETLRVGTYRLCDIDATLKERAKTRDRIKWLKEQHADEQTNKKEVLGV